MKRYSRAATWLLAAALAWAGGSLGPAARAADGPTGPASPGARVWVPGISAVPAAAETPADEALSITVRGHFAGGWQLVGGSHNSSKFEEYREVPYGIYIRQLTLVGESKEKTKFVQFIGSNIRQTDEFAQLRLGKYGGQQLMVTFDRIPHDFSNTGRLLFHEASPNTFTLPAQVRADLKAISTTDINPAVGGTQIDTAAFGDLVNGLAHPIPLELRRRTTTLEWLGEFSPNLAASVSYQHEKYHGSRPIGTTFAFTNQNELPEPMNYGVNDVRAGLDYEWRQGALAVNATYSHFNNPDKVLVWDNPIQTTDTVGSPAHGRMSLPPDNTANNVSLSGAVHLSRMATLSGVVSRGSWRQNESLIPYTINSALTPPALPITSADAKIDTSLMDFALNVAPAQAVSLRAFYRQYDNDNKTPMVTFPGEVEADTTVSTEASDTRPISYQKRNYGIGAEVDATRRLSLGVRAEEETWHRQFRDVSKTRDGRLGLNADYRVGTWLSARASVKTSRRRIRGPYVPDEAQLPEMRKFDEADRDRNEAALLLNASTPDGRWDWTLSYTRAHNDYLHSPYGLTRADNDTFSLEAAYAMSDATSLFAGWIPERYVYDMTSRYRPVVGTTVIDDPLNDWSSTIANHVQTVWLGANHVLVPGKLDVGLSLTSSVGREQITSFGVPGGDPNGEPPALPRVRFSLMEPELDVNYHASATLTTAFSYRMERYRETDFAQDIMEPYMPQTDALTSTWLGARQPGYTAHIFTLEVRQSF